MNRQIKEQTRLTHTEVVISYVRPFLSMTNGEHPKSRLVPSIGAKIWNFKIIVIKNYKK